MMNPQLLADPFFIFGGLGLIFGLIGILLSVFWLWMLIDAITNKSLEGVEKIIWVLVIFFTHILGAVLYYFVGRGSRAGGVRL